MEILADLRVVDAGTSVATAHAARVLALLGAGVSSHNAAWRLLEDSPAPGGGPDAAADVVLVDAGGGDGAPAAPVVVEVGHAAGDPTERERDLQEHYGLAALTGDVGGPALLTGGWPVLLHAGAQAAVAALLGAVDVARGGGAHAMRVDARGASGWLLGEASTRVAWGLDPPPRRGTATLVADGRLVRVRDGWVSLTAAGDDARLLDALAAAAGVAAGGGTEDPTGGLSARARAWLAGMTRAAAVTCLDELRIPCGGGTSAAELAATGARPDVRCTFAPAPTAFRPGRASLPLDGVRVVEVAAMWAGPGAAAVLAAWGADVVKVEAPRRPDGTRAGAPPGRPGGPLFAALNAGKRGLSLDVGTPHGRDALIAVLAATDLLVDSQAPRVLPNWGLAQATLRAAVPALGVLHLPAVGSTGGATRVAYGFDQEMLCGQALAGGDRPRPAGVPLGDPVAATVGAATLLALLWRRLRTGAVGHAVVAQRDALLHQVAGRVAAATGGRPWVGDRLAGLEASRARGLHEAMADSVLAASGAVDAGDVGGVRPAILCDGAPPPKAGPPPAHGGHTVEVLRAAGVDPGPLLDAGVATAAGGGPR